MRTLYASKAFATTAGKGLISAANPLALGGLLFRGGLKGVGFIQRKLANANFDTPNDVPRSTILPTATEAWKPL